VDSDERDLGELRWHWSSAYVITRTAPGVWLAQRRDTREVLRSDTAAGLREAIGEDYRQRPVPRGGDTE
jgi:hypothetical protein